MLSSQPTPLEIAVTLQGATPVAGSDRRELFTETTKTTLVFENGAVVSLKAQVAPGQCLFLRNEQSGREILCKVLETRPSGSGRYTDLEFTSRNPGFWDPPAAEPAAGAQNDSQLSSIPAPAETQVVALKLEPVGAPGETRTTANAPETSAPATTETEPAASATATTAPVSAADTEADWNEAKDAQLAAALELMAGDAKPKTKSKPKRKSAIAGTEANGTDDAAPQVETTLEATGDAKVASILPSLTGKISDFDLAKNKITVGIAASLVLLAMLGIAWHARRRPAPRANDHPVAPPAPSAEHAPANASPTSQMQTTTSVASTSAAAMPTETSTSSATNAGASSASPTDTAPPSAADSAAQDKHNSEGPTLAHVKHRQPKQARTGEIIPVKIVSQAPPAIPSWAKKLELDHPVVLLEAVVDAKGNLTSTKPLSGPRVLQGEAERAVALWIFEPALQDGKPIPAHMILTVEFQR